VLSDRATPQVSPATTLKPRRPNSSFKGSISASSFFAFARRAPAVDQLLPGQRGRGDSGHAAPPLTLIARRRRTEAGSSRPLSGIKPANVSRVAEDPRTDFDQLFLERLRIPIKPVMHSDRKPATDSDLKPAGIPI
jgi:hypothetical protein